MISPYLYVMLGQAGLFASVTVYLSQPYLREEQLGWLGVMFLVSLAWMLYWVFNL